MSLSLLLVIFLHYTLILLCYQLCKPSFSVLAKKAAKLFNVYLNDSLSEDDKIGKLWKLNFQLIGWFLFFGLCIGTSLILIFAPFELVHQPIDLFNNWKEWLTITAFFSILFFLFKKVRSNDYNYWSVLLHHLVLDNDFIGKWLFNNAKRKVKNQGSPYLIITGLARSGTTALLNQLGATNQFKSLSYQDMPFIMSPGLIPTWLGSSKTKKERAHGDGIETSQNSLEAFEEVFFKSELNNNFIKDQNLVQHELPDNTILNYSLFRSLVTKHEAFYLAKNNNAVLRMKSLLAKDKDVRVVVMFRDPIQQAISLKKQHENFEFLQEEDSFVLTYMNWLGHHEFGLGHKPFDFGIDHRFNPTQLNYWLLSWCNYYEYILKEILPSNQVVLVCFETLCKQPNKVVSHISDLLNIDIFVKNIAAYTPAIKEGEVNLKLKEKAEYIYAELLKHINS